jgi:molybdopterin synthase sulfur carrier subunit
VLPVEEHMPVTIRIPTPLRSLTKGSAEVHAEGDTVDDVVHDLERQFPGLRDRLMDEKGELRRFINLYVNEEDVRFLDGRTTILKEGDTVSIVPAIAGGR